MTGRTRSAALTTGAVLALAAVLSGCGGSSSSSSSSASGATSAATSTAAVTTTATTTATTTTTPAGPTVVTAKLTEFAIAPTPATVPAGAVTFQVTNAGKIKHQFTIISTDKPAATVLSKADPNDDIPGARGEIASLAPGATKTLVIKNLKAGHYALVCALPGHYQSGMYKDFTVQ